MLRGMVMREVAYIFFMLRTRVISLCYRPQIVQLEDTVGGGISVLRASPILVEQNFGCDEIALSPKF